MGVQVALETMRRHAPMNAGLILMCGASEHPLRTFHHSSVLEAVLPIVRRAVARAPHVASAISRLIIPTRLAYEVAARLEIDRERVDFHDFMPYLEGMARVEITYFLAVLAEAGRHSARDVLPTLRVPVLVVAGERDGFTPVALSRTMAAETPDAELVVVPDGSHTAPLEHPREIGDAVLDFLARRVGRAA
jgi:pimeloyl-ACP methyl ester carboxylesterase